MRAVAHYSLLAFTLAIVAVTAVAGAGANAALIGSKQEQQIGAQAAAQIESRYGLYTNPSWNRYVQAMGRRIAAQSPRHDIAWHFKILNTGDVNAVSLPGGYIYVFRGLLNFVGRDQGMLAGVIAHEVGHVSAHHQTKMMEREFWTNAALSLFTHGRTQQLASMFSNIYDLHFSRKDEYQADQLGVKYASRAGYDPYGLARFLQKLEARYGNGPSGIASYLATHPSNSARIQRARAYAAQYAR